MGSSASIYLDKLNPELKEVLEEIEKRKLKLIENDVDLLDRESSKIFKKHDKIITTLTSRSKTLLKKLNSDTKYSTPDHIYKIIGGNNNYAKFIKMIFMSKQDIEMENILLSSASPEYDEELLLNIIGTSSIKEIQLLDLKYQEVKGKSLYSLFESKTKEGSQLRKLLTEIFKYERDESKDKNLELAAKYANDIHQAGAAKLMGVDEDLVYNIICKCSRAQCTAIADSYMSQFNIKFERAINMKFKDRMIVDKYAIMSYIAKYDKDFLAHTDTACEKLYDKKLHELLKRGLSGNLLDAVYGWIENPTPDKGYERVLELFLEAQLIEQGRNLDELITTEEFQKRVLFIAKKQLSEIQKYYSDNKIKYSDSDDYNLKTIDSFHVIHSQSQLFKSISSSMSLKSVDDNESMKDPSLSPSKESTLESSSPSRGVSFSLNPNESTRKLSITTNDNTRKLSAISVGSTNEVDDDVFDDSGLQPILEEKSSKYTITKFTLRSQQSFVKSNQYLVESYLKEILTRLDPSNDMYIEADQFWLALSELPFEHLGITKEDFLKIRTWCDWEDEDGKIYYFETLHELTDTIIASIEHKTTGDKNVKSVIEQCIDDQKLDLSTSIIHSEKITGLDPTISKIIPPYFLQYLYDTFEAFDFDNNHFLSHSELIELIPAMNIDVLTIRDFIENDAAEIHHHDAVKVVAKAIEPWFEDDADHYICLVDKTCGLYFWFNTCDETTQWADENLANETLTPEIVNTRKSMMGNFPISGLDLKGLAAISGYGLSVKTSRSLISPRAPTNLEEKEMDNLHQSAGIAATKDDNQ